MTTKAKKDYSKGKIYKIEPICDHEDGEIYIGSTTKDYLSQRMVKHKGDYKRWTEGGKASFTRSYIIFDKYGFENCTIILLENVNASCYDDLAAREAYYIKSLMCVNKSIPLRNKREYRNDNKDLYSLWQKKYYENNKKILTERQRRYDETNKNQISEKRKQKYVCECGSVCRKVDKSTHIKTMKHQKYLNTLQV